ncbi:DoxX family protein [Actinomycetospora straminea]|uniref:DoxX family protein n=1 Tax=Actinomycetospora straminea TaxID=663607 RepID=A0ABP9EXW6_9PSEU|nr:DoxX family protein [Actinomycetospora straminea]MDD7931868.1 DoxX family protein [Actinomycetospora straminea]
MRPVREVVVRDALSVRAAARQVRLARGRRPGVTLLRPWALLAFRCVVTALFLLHPVGAFGVLDGSTPAAPMIAISAVEIVAVLLVAVGLYARVAAFVLSGMMAFAFFVVHLPSGWNWLENGGEPAALYSWVFLLLVVLGPGSLSLDRRRIAPAAG